MKTPDQRILAGLWLAALGGLGTAYALPGPTAAVPQDEPIFAADVLPVFRANCISCHGSIEPAGELDLTSFDGLMKGGISGTAIEPGDADDSLLIRRMVSDDDGAIMPLGFPAIASSKLDKIAAWIISGAKKGGETGEHWAYVPPLRATPPVVTNSAWPENPIDNFILAKLDKNDLEPKPRADKGKLLRRLSLDMTGLPPTVEELDAFESDDAKGAWSRAIDRLLASPHFGERQALDWLDLARFADSNGYRHDGARSMWAFRDYVIQALNDDMPFDQFTIEQIAGDLLPNPTTDQLVAAGFHRNTMHNTEGGVVAEEARWLTNVDRVATTGLVWMATSFGCAQCHDHKFEPLSHEEFFGLYAYFDDVDEVNVDLSTAEQILERKRIDKEIKAAQEAGKALTKDSPEQKASAALVKKLQNERKKNVGPTSLGFREQKYEGAPKAQIREKGSFLAPGEEVSAGIPAFLHNLPENAPQNRLGLAQWLVADDNPLVARVIVNRIWELYFGRGIVVTSGDFGTQSEPPTHPELLDWLAVELMENGWSLKYIHKLIASSATYQQSSKANLEQRELDPDLALYSRGPRHRLGAEVIRDSALYAGGILNMRIGGPSVKPKQPAGLWDAPNDGARWVNTTSEERLRRGLYVYRKRTSMYPSFTAFDATSREECTTHRYRTNTPLQAMVLLNDPVYIEAARGLGHRMTSKMGSNRDRIAYGFRLCTSRRPTKTELDILEKHLFGQLAKRSMIGANNGDLGETPNEAAWTMVGSALLNLDETITKE